LRLHVIDDALDDPLARHVLPGSNQKDEGAFLESAQPHLHLPALQERQHTGLLGL
jgi:hypothetical protein